MSQKDNFGSFAGNQRIFVNELEYALETTTLFGQTPQRSSQRSAAIRDFNTIPHLVPVARPEYLLVPADGPFCPSVHGGTPTFIYPNATRAPNGQIQRLNIYQPTMPFLVPSSFSHGQTFNQSLPVCNSSSSTQTNQYQPPKSVGALGASTLSQRVVQVPKSTPKVVPNSAYVPGPSRPTSKPVRPPKRTLIIEKDIFAPGAENQRMINLRDLMGLPPDKNEAKITYSILPKSRSKKTCLQPKHRVDLKSLLAESETQSHAKMTSTREVSKGCSTSRLTVSGPAKKKAKIEYKEEDLDLGAMYALLAESIDLRAALASGEIRVEEQKKTTAKPSPVLQQTSTAPESNEAVSHTNRFIHSKSSSSRVSVDAGQKESKKEMSKPKEEKELVTLEEIFSLDKSETQALFEDSFKDVDQNSMSDTYLCHEEYPLDNSCLREILDSAEFSELFESTGDDDTTTGTTTTPMANENHPSATEESLSSVGADFFELVDSDDDDTIPTASIDSYSFTTEGSPSSVGDDFVELTDSDDDTITTASIVSHPSTTEGSLSPVGADFAELFESSDDDTTNISTTPSTETRPSAREERVNPVDKLEVSPKPRSSMTIEELFLCNRERVMEQVAAKQEQEYQYSSLDSDEFTTSPPKTEVFKVLEETTNNVPFPDYIPDMFLFSATDPDVGLNAMGQPAPANTGQPFIDEIRTPPPPDACLKQPVGHYDTVPEGPLDMMRADGNVYLEKVHKVEGFQYVFDEFKIPGNNIIVDPATLQTPRLPTPGRKRPRSHDYSYMCDNSQSAKKFKVDAGSWVTCSNLGNDSEKFKKPKRRYGNKARNPTGGKWLPVDH